jgi:hypothetical protein
MSGDSVGATDEEITEITFQSDSTHSRVTYPAANSDNYATSSNNKPPLEKPGRTLNRNTWVWDHFRLYVCKRLRFDDDHRRLVNCNHCNRDVNYGAHHFYCCLLTLTFSQTFEVSFLHTLPALSVHRIARKPQKTVILRTRILRHRKFGDPLLILFQFRP